MSAALDFARREAAKDAVRTAATRLSARSIPVAPLKGALVSARWLSVDVPRPLTDVDLLVPGDRFQEARAALLEGGGRIGGVDRDDRSATLLVPWCPMSIDLHQRLFPKLLFREDPRRMLARATIDRDLYGASVLLLHPHDAIAHALGHHAMGRPLVSRERLATDLEAIGRDVRDPRLLRFDLRRMGLLRAALFAELDLARGTIPWLDQVVDGARLGPLETRAVRLALELARTDVTGPGSASTMTRHVMNDGFARGALSAAVQVLQRLTRESRLARLRRAR